MENAKIFKEFIESLESINSLPKKQKQPIEPSRVKARDMAEKFVDNLVEKYNLPEDEEAKQMLYDILCESQIFEKFIYIGETKCAYIRALLNHHVLMGASKAELVNFSFVYGLALGQLLSYEEDEEDYEEDE